MTQTGQASVIDSNGEQVSLQTLWEIFYARNKKLPYKYRVYRYFKEAG